MIVLRISIEYMQTLTEVIGLADLGEKRLHNATN